ncbi:MULTISPECIES: hypothetical protein [Kamptonema]|uniref:hypothetical protein n=1 Tax=Kamptonema TaxID=1501433 RepID=UPI0002D9A12B|nr:MULTISPECIES: hypothetical protein [Kamptonema]
MTKNEFRIWIAKMIGYPAAIVIVLILIIGEVKIDRDFPSLLCGANLGLMLAILPEYLRKIE